MELIFAKQTNQRFASEKIKKPDYKQGRPNRFQTYWKHEIKQRHQDARDMGGAKEGLGKGYAQSPVWELSHPQPPPVREFRQEIMTMKT